MLSCLLGKVMTEGLERASVENNMPDKYRNSLQCRTEHPKLFSLWPDLCEVFKTNKTG